MKVKLDEIKVKFDNNQWQMKVGGGGWQGPPYPQIQVPEDNVGVLAFEIISTNDVNFHQSDPFVQKGGTIQNPQKADFNDQFIVLGKGERELTVIDVNGMKEGSTYQGGSYEYKLQFDVPAGSNIPQQLDPIITNMGCCKLYSYSGIEVAGYSLLIATAGALAAVGYRKWRAKG